jgi:hypothetical protein
MQDEVAIRLANNAWYAVTTERKHRIFWELAEGGGPAPQAGPAERAIRAPAPASGLCLLSEEETEARSRAACSTTCWTR